ncbi:MAG: M48 family metallopeptidase [Candidatus Planktophila sp.]|nr:M48 family metallopeptidase [Candidatus Planktophila sp.]
MHSVVQRLSRNWIDSTWSRRAVGAGQKAPNCSSRLNFSLNSSPSSTKIAMKQAYSLRSLWWDWFMTTAELLLLGIVTFILIDFAAGRVIDYLNESNKNQPLSPVASEIYNSDEYAKSLEYGTAKYKVELFTSVASTVVMLSAIILGWFAWLDQQIRDRFDNELLITVIFVGVLIVISMLGSLPVGYYSTFVIEEKFGFNKTTKKLFISDAIKGLALSLIVGLPLLALIALVYQELQSSFWLVGWLLVSAFSLFMFIFGTRIFLPMFNKLKPLPDGELRTAVEEYCQSQGFPLSKLYEMDASKRSTKLNAFFSGMGKVKIIGLYDTLIAKLTTQETVAVLAHEVGHYKRKHVYTMFAFSNVQTLVIFGLMGWLLGNPNLSKALGSDTPSFHLSILAFFMLFTPVSTVLGLINNSFSRHNEYQADQYSIDTYPGAREHMYSALKKLSVESLSNLNPHPVYVAVHYSHPPILDRLANLQKV